MGELIQKRMKGKANTNGFDKNKQNIVPGRPKKGISLFLQQCKDNNIEQPSKQNIEATYLSLINMSAEELKKVGVDEKQPLVVRKLAQFITNAKDIDLFEKMIDRVHGKPTQKVEQNSKTTIEVNKTDQEKLNDLLNINNL